MGARDGRERPNKETKKRGSRLAMACGVGNDGDCSAVDNAAGVVVVNVVLVGGDSWVSCISRRNVSIKMLDLGTFNPSKSMSRIHLILA